MYLRGYAGRKPVRKKKMDRAEAIPPRDHSNIETLLGRFQKSLRLISRVIALMTLIWAVLLLARHLVYRSDYLKINDVRVMGIDDADKVMEVLTVSGITPREYLFRVDLAEVSRRVITLPYIRKVDAQVDVSNALTIKVDERQGSMLVRARGGDFAVVDEDRTVIRITSKPDEEEMKLPLVTGIDLEGTLPGSAINNPAILAAQEWLEALDSETRTEMAELSVKSPFEMWLIYQNGDTVKGDVPANYQARNRELRSLRKYLSRRGIKTAYIDIRYDIGYVVKRF
ncbi:MAG: hypothetical protein CVV64_09285 [Candidatus Wallbacteria bacterium HGW-Wallbacteria-1]|jgi:cell division septal protein FtsQ|uniref:POTRA domain-containing protein n=1 Tax=Candidatus Wallbacteria bacterium HGW-Wallbacteria-1 TaxID=2013854 RepID=A0A2N1PQD7_9BACT|nr:MAG: hypothetical protein CVV64_09285 [Candidatus Wallbacteria bacterium HGW-Wallbacteria-1]